MEAGILIWVLLALAVALGLVAVTLAHLARVEAKEGRRENDERWRNVDARLSGVETNTSTLVRNLPTGPALVATFTVPGSSESIDPVYPTPPDGPRSTALPPLTRKR